jgi:colicin import membrane protein
MYKSLTLPLLVTLFFHGLIVAIVLIDAPQSSPIIKRAATQYIRAELVVLDKPKAKKPVVNQAKPAPKNKDTEAKKTAEKAKKTAEKALLQSQLDQQKLKEQQKQQQKQKQEKQDRKIAKEAKERARIKQQSEQDFADAIAQENAQNQAMTDDDIATSYIALITEVIQRNWNRPPSARNSMETELALRLVPTGEVVGVTIVSSSGNAAFDRSAENAVLKAERFPEIQQLPPRVFEQYFRSLRLKFRPEDLRL